ncbi:hypothetical protein D3C73_1483980 [compost metagenome]
MFINRKEPVQLSFSPIAIGVIFLAFSVFTTSTISSKVVGTFTPAWVNNSLL